MPGVDLNFVEETVQRIGRKPEALIPILQALQEHHGYLPKEVLVRLSELTEIRPSAISGVSTFYDMFRHKPAGKHIFRICRGTACHVAGAERVEEALRRHLRIPPGADTDAAQEFTIEQVACLGCCTLAPVVKMGDCDDGIRVRGECAGASARVSCPADGGGQREVHRGIETSVRQWLRPNPRRPRFLLHGQGQRSVISRLARKRRPMRRRMWPSSAWVAWACAIARR